MAEKGMSVFTHEGEDYTINDPNIANEFSSSTAYSEGTYVNYKGGLYRFTSDHAAGAWNASQVTLVKLGQDLTGKINELGQDLTGEINELGQDLNGKINGYIGGSSAKNLFNRFDGNIQYGKYFFNGSLQDNTNMGFVKIEVKTNGSYSMLGDPSFFGTNANKIPVFKKSDGSYISTKDGTLNSGNNIVTWSDLSTITTEDTALIGYTFRLGNAGNSFVCEGTLTQLPALVTKLNEMIDVDPVAKSNISHKTAMFFGDSICAGTTVPVADTDYYNWGWAGRVGYKNGMVWKNFGSNGASITEMTGRSCIANIVRTQIALYPDTDYIILEGGTNDADVIASDPAYSLGTFDEFDFTSEYDLTTFCGSFETLLRDVISAFPGGKVGFIIAQKMGVYTESLTRRKELFDKAKGICEKWGIKYINLWETCSINPMIDEYYDPSLTIAQNIAGKYYVDGQHLTDKGYDLVSEFIEAWMNTL